MRREVALRIDALIFSLEVHALQIQGLHGFLLVRRQLARNPHKRVRGFESRFKHFAWNSQDAGEQPRRQLLVAKLGGHRKCRIHGDAHRQRVHVAIVDRNMHPLAMSIPVDSAFAVPSELGDEQLAARLLSGVLGIPREVLEARFESSHSFVWIARKLPPDKKEAVEALNLKGVYFQRENQRIYPKRDLASHVLGFVDLDEKGLGGIEYELDGQIRGKSEKIIVMADARQRWFDGGEAQRELGASVVLTLDEKIQYIAERELAAAIAKTRAMAGTVMVMNPNTGEILGLANWPKFNPNAANEAPAEARMNRAVTALYEPGSTFKLITLAAAFDQGITRPEEVFDCENGA